MEIFYITALYAPIHFLLIILTVTAYRKYSPSDLAISQLGTGKSPRRKIFNLSQITLGVLVLLLGNELIMSQSPIVHNLTPYILRTIGVCLILIAFVPYDSNPLLHNIIAVVLISSILFFNVILGAETYKDLSFSQGIHIPIAFSVICTVGLAVFRAIGAITGETLKGTWYWEWGLFASGLIVLFLYNFLFIIQRIP